MVAAISNPVPLELLRELFSYDENTGILTRLVTRCTRNAVAGDAITRTDRHGYVVVSISHKTILAHRIAWAMCTGAWPEGDIDHMNGIKHDNRFCNLRDVSRKLNLQNQKRAHKDSKTGLLGVRQGYKGSFYSIIYHNGATKHLGTFKTPEAAHAAYLTAKQVLHEGAL